MLDHEVYGFGTGRFLLLYRNICKWMDAISQKIVISHSLPSPETSRIMETEGLSSGQTDLFSI
jgi:hypothetical protein